MEFTVDSLTTSIVTRNTDQTTMLRKTRTNQVENLFMNELRVLAIDDNIVCLKVLTSSLEKCKYRVKATTKAREALEILRKKEEIYDIVITDVKMHEMDGFQLLEIIGLEMDIPVIMISASGDKELVMKGVRHGARDYLVKPVRMEELRNIWQHVMRKNMFEPNTSKSSITRVEVADNSMMNSMSVSNPVINAGESCPPKKPRISWSKARHQKFIDAIEILGPDAYPKKILELMDDPELSRENVASHLQKYRKFLKKEKTEMQSTERLISNVVNNMNNGPPPPPLQAFIPSNKNQFFFQQNQQLPPAYANYFHQTPVFPPNPPPPWNRSISCFNAINNPNHPIISNVDPKIATFAQANPNPNHTYVVPPYLSHNPNNSYDMHNLQVTISQPAPINIHTNPIILAPNMPAFDPSHVDEHSLLNTGSGSVGNSTSFDNDWIMVSQNERQTSEISTDDDLNAIIKEFHDGSPKL